MPYSIALNALRELFKGETRDCLSLVSSLQMHSMQIVLGQCAIYSLLLRHINSTIKFFLTIYHKVCRMYTVRQPIFRKFVIAPRTFVSELKVIFVCLETCFLMVVSYILNFKVKMGLTFKLVTNLVDINHVNSS